MQKGLIIVFTGDGKGKTSAALGIALRSSGHRMQVSMIQFVKSSTESGEERAAERLKPDYELLTMGKGFVNHPGSRVPFEKHLQAAAEALSLARQRITSGFWDVVILDEINVAVHLGLVDIGDVLALLREKPAKLHVVLTGRNANAAVIDMADMVTEMRDIKHPYGNGTQAQKGIDY